MFQRNRQIADTRAGGRSGAQPGRQPGRQPPDPPVWPDSALLPLLEPYSETLLGEKKPYNYLSIRDMKHTTVGVVCAGGGTPGQQHVN